MVSKSIRVRMSSIIDTLTPVHQYDDSSCGPAIAQSVLAKYGVDVDQRELAALMHTTAKGTTWSNWVNGISLFPITTQLVTSVSMEVLLANLRAGDSAVVTVNAYGGGHYVALVGASRRNYFFCDPMSEVGFSYIGVDTLARRWCDRTAAIVSGRRKPSSILLAAMEE